MRRAAIGIIAMLRTMPTVSLKDLIAASLDAYAEQGLEFDRAAVAEKVEQFFAGRLKAIAKDEGVLLDSIEAVSAVGVIDPAEFFARACALDAARAEQPETYEALAGAFTRAHNLADAALGCEVDTSILGDSELALLRACEEGEGKVSSALACKDFDAACSALAALKEPIDAFFEDVMVMDENASLRENRLRLLNRFVGVFTDVADFGLMAKKAQK